MNAWMTFLEKSEIEGDCVRSLERRKRSRGINEEIKNMIINNVQNEY